jgi:alpha-L-glutamate ligase-like protein
MKSYKDILGLNSRYLDYILNSNTKEKIKFADSKLKTKQYLQARGIAVPRLHAIIDSHESLSKFDFGNLNTSTVLKPNQGSRGRGIIPIKNIKNNKIITVNEKEYEFSEIKSHIADIIDGKYSLGNIRDTAFFEQRIITDKSLQDLSYKGLPDIRVVVYKNTPAMAMLRLPNKESEGKANLDAGAYGFGIDIGNGKLTYLIKGKKILSDFKGEIDIPEDFKIPYFQEILEMVCECQKLTGLGYLGCDIALDQNMGPVLIELNARPGLKIQLANKAGLKTRLLQIDKIRSKDIKTKIETAKALFSNQKKNETEKKDKTVLGPIEQVNLLDYETITNAKIDPISRQNFISSKLLEKLNIKDENPIIKIRVSNIRQTVSFKRIEKDEDELILGIGSNQQFLYDNTKILEKKLPSYKPKKTNFEFFYKPQINYGELDFKIHEISKSIKLLKRLTPDNLTEEIQKFKIDNTYNPQFVYQDNSEFLFSQIKKLRSLKCEDDPVGQLFDKKIKHLEKTLKMIASIGTDNFSNTALEIYKAPKLSLIEEAEKDAVNCKLYDHSESINHEEAIKLLESFINENNLKNIQIKVEKNIISDISVNKKGTIFIKKGAKFNKQRIEKLITHEIETHIYTALNGEAQPYRIFTDGTANYLETQEGLAVYNQEKQLGFTQNCYASDVLINNNIAYHNSFASGYDALIKQGKSENSAIKAILKTKRGVSDTSQNGGNFKSSIYYSGAKKIKNYIDKGNDYKELYIGKINLEDLELIRSIKTLNPPKLLPRFYLGSN